MFADIMLVASIAMFVLLIRGNPLILQGSEQVDIRVSNSHFYSLCF